MPPIRPLERSDLPQVVSLYEHVARSGSRTAPPGMLEYFERFFLDHPWADPEIPSLVYEGSDGSVVGFLGSSVRRFRFDGRPLRAGCSGQLVTEPSIRNEAAGAFLMRAYMDGPQDMTFTDTASDLVRRIWERLGGQSFGTGCIGWVRVFRPWQFVAAYRARHDPAAGLPPLVGPVTSALDVVSARVPRAGFRTGETETRGERLTASALGELLPDAVGAPRLHPDYDEAFAEWLLGALAEVSTHGRLTATLVRGDDDRVLGWYVYYAKRGGIGQVMQIAGDERNLGPVVDHLFHAAEREGVAALQGRLEPRLRETLSSRRTLLHYSGYLSLVHAREPAVLAALESTRTLFTRLEGEWWMGHHLQPFGAPSPATAG
jgi:hypothetical protein